MRHILSKYGGFWGKIVEILSKQLAAHLLCTHNQWYKCERRLFGMTTCNQITQVPTLAHTNSQEQRPTVRFDNPLP